MVPIELKELPLEPNGHLFSSSEVLVAFYDPADTKMPPTIMSDDWQRCAMCDGSGKRKVVGDKVVATEPCSIPDGITTTITLAVRSGKLVVADDLRPIYDWSEGPCTASYNTALGQAQAVQAMAALGCAYGPVGNSCPKLFRTGPDTYVIARAEYDDGDEITSPLAAAEQLVSITTNLWAYSLADYDGWVARGEAWIAEDPKDHAERRKRVEWLQSKVATIIDFPPGVYEFTHHTGEKDFDHYADGDVVFAHIRKIG